MARDIVTQTGIVDEAYQFIQESLKKAEAIAASINFSHPVFNHLLAFLAEHGH
jgi:hypothetical protein